MVIEKFRAAVEKIGQAVKALNDQAVLTLPNGSTITGAELKVLWKSVDFVINPQGFNDYKNKSVRGEADYNGGDPVISFNIDLVEGYAKHAAGLNFVVAHDLGHLAKAARDFDQKIQEGGVTEEERLARERMASDISRALNHNAGLQVLQDPIDGYSTPDPLPFKMPSTGDDGDGGGGGVDPGDPGVLPTPI